MMLLMVPGLLQAQHRNPVATQSNCIDLTDLTAPYIHCTYGFFSNPYANDGIASGRHTVITQQAIDSLTCSYMCVLHLDKIPPNETYSVKLGNSDVGARAESIAVDITIDTNIFDLLVLKYAAVLQDPGHEPSGQPRTGRWHGKERISLTTRLLTNTTYRYLPVLPILSTMA